MLFLEDRSLDNIITKGVLTMYTIGQMSQLCHISARRLRYYEAMGLLKPAAAVENG